MIRTTPPLPSARLEDFTGAFERTETPRIAVFGRRSRCQNTDSGPSEFWVLITRFWNMASSTTDFQTCLCPKSAPGIKYSMISRLKDLTRSPPLFSLPAHPRKSFPRWQIQLRQFLWRTQSSSISAASWAIHWSVLFYPQSSGVFRACKRESIPRPICPFPHSTCSSFIYFVK